MPLIILDVYGVGINFNKEMVMTRFEILVQRGAEVHKSPNNADKDYIGFVEPLDAEKMFVGRAFRDGVVEGDNVYGMMSI